MVRFYRLENRIYAARQGLDVELFIEESWEVVDGELREVTTSYFAGFFHNGFRGRHCKLRVERDKEDFRDALI